MQCDRRGCMLTHNWKKMTYAENKTMVDSSGSIEKLFEN